MKKLVTLALALVMVLSLGSVAMAENAEKINLVYYYCGSGVQRDTQLVNDRINELLAQTPGMENVTVTLMPTLMNEYQQKLLLAMTAEEQVDIVSTFASSANINDDFRKGIYIPLDDLMALIPDTVAELPEWILDYGKVDGKQYYIPTYQQNGNQRMLIIPEEYLPYIADGTKEGIRKVLWEGTSEEKIDMMLDYTRKVREAHPEKEIYTVAPASLEFPENWYAWQPTCHYAEAETPLLIKRFLSAPESEDLLLHIFGHSYEMTNPDRHHGWVYFESLLKLLSGRQDVVYATNSEAMRRIREKN